MDTNELIRRMEDHGIRPTANRIRIAAALDAQKRPQTLSELEILLDTIDKSGIFRTLVLFRDHHFVHAVEDGCEGTRYELCRSLSGEGEDEDMHVHFHCEKCHRTYCLEDIPVPRVQLPDGYRPEEANYMISGICPACNHEIQSI